MLQFRRILHRKIECRFLGRRHPAFPPHPDIYQCFKVRGPGSRRQPCTLRSMGPVRTGLFDVAAQPQDGTTCRNSRHVVPPSPVIATGSWSSHKTSPRYSVSPQPTIQQNRTVTLGLLNVPTGAIGTSAVARAFKQL